MYIDFELLAVIATIITLIGTAIVIVKKFGKAIITWFRIPKTLNKIEKKIEELNSPPINTTRKKSQITPLLFDMLKRDIQRIQNWSSFEDFANRFGKYIMFVYPEITRISVITPPDVFSPYNQREKRPKKLIITIVLLGSEISKRKREWILTEKNKKGIPGRVYAGKPTIYVCNDVTKDPYFIARADPTYWDYPAYLSLIDTLISCKERKYGVLSVSARSAYFWDDDDKSIIKHFVDLLGEAFYQLESSFES